MNKSNNLENSKVLQDAKIFGLAVLCALLANCSNQGASNSGDSSIIAPLIVDSSGGVDFSTNLQMAKMNVNQYPLNKLVCDPMGGGDPQPQSNAGIKAELYWINPNTQPHYQNVGDLIANGQKSDKTLFFSQINVPTRMFNLGFPLESGGMVKDDSNNNLLEYFALRFKTVAKLAPDQSEGLYEFAVLSDDGTVVRMRNDTGTYETLINNDGVHPTRLGCGNKLVQMNRDTEKLWEIDYHQGPKYHISAVMLMRKVQTDANGQIVQESACGVTGNSTWFDPDNNSVPKSAYNNLLSRGWKPMVAQNFALPLQTATFNPCMEGQVPVITNFHVVERADTSVWLEWNTDIPATSQVLWRLANSNSLQITMADNVLRTTKHTVVVDGLQAGQLYEFQAVAISESYGKAISNPIQVNLNF